MTVSSLFASGTPPRYSTQDSCSCGFLLCRLGLLLSTSTLASCGNWTRDTAPEFYKSAGGGPWTHSVRPASLMRSGIFSAQTSGQDLVLKGVKFLKIGLPAENQTLEDLSI